MRLIDADKLLQDMKRNCNGNCKRCADYTILSSDHHCGVIDRQPTAYDVDEMIKALEEEKFVYYASDDDEARGYNDGLNEALRIVKRGGRNDNR